VVRTHNAHWSSTLGTQRENWQMILVKRRALHACVMTSSDCSCRGLISMNSTQWALLVKLLPLWFCRNLSEFFPVTRIWQGYYHVHLVHIQFVEIRYCSEDYMKLSRIFQCLFHSVIIAMAREVATYMDGWKHLQKLMQQINSLMSCCCTALSSVACLGISNSTHSGKASLWISCLHSLGSREIHLFSSL